MPGPAAGSEEKASLDAVAVPRRVAPDVARATVPPYEVGVVSGAVVEPVVVEADLESFRENVRAPDEPAERPAEPPVSQLVAAAPEFELV